MSTIISNKTSHKFVSTCAYDCGRDALVLTDHGTTPEDWH